MTGFEPATSAMATPRSPELSYIHLEPFPGVEPGGLSRPRTRARRREGRWAGGTATAERCPLPRHPKSGPSRCPESHLPGSNGSPAHYKWAALPAELRWRAAIGAPGGIRTPTSQHLGLVPPAIGLRERRASDWPRTSCLPLTRRTLSQMSYRGLAAGQGFEPRLAESESAVLPVRRSSNGVRRQGLEPR
jgi:hypothetical protein